METEIDKKIHINIKIPSDYGTSFYDSSLNIYSIIAHSPERIISIGILNDIAFNYKSIFNIRNTIGKKYWDGDYIDTSFIKLIVDTVLFNGYNAIEIIGVWSNNEKNYGGPFLSYIVQYKGKTLYLDGQLLLPGKRKFFKLMELKTVMYSIYGLK